MCCFMCLLLSDDYGNLDEDYWCLFKVFFNALCSPNRMIVRRIASNRRGLRVVGRKTFCNDAAAEQSSSQASNVSFFLAFMVS